MCFGRYRILIGSSEGVSGTLGKDMGLMGQERECTSHKGLVRPHSRPAYEEKERGGGQTLNNSVS